MESNIKKDTELKEIGRIVETYFKYKIRHVCTYIDKRELQYILYEAFDVRFSLDERYGIFGAGIRLSDECLLTGKILGTSFLHGSDEKSIIQDLKTIDEYCMLRLPDKYLEEFEKRTKEDYFDLFKE